jgi:hypothetical protein
MAKAVPLQSKCVRERLAVWLKPCPFKANAFVSA